MQRPGALRCGRSLGVRHEQRLGVLQHLPFRRGRAPRAPRSHVAWAQDPAFNRLKVGFLSAPSHHLGVLVCRRCILLQGACGHCHVEPASSGPQDVDQALVTLPGAVRARYHLQAGVDHIFLKSEDSPETSATLQQLGAQERAKVTSWAAGPGHGRPADDYSALQVRQMAMMARARDAAVEMGLEWPGTIDFIVGPRSKLPGRCASHLGATSWPNC